MYFRKLYLTEASIFSKKQIQAIGNSNQVFDKEDAKNKAKNLNLNRRETKDYIKQQQANAGKTPDQKMRELLENGEVVGFENFKDWSPTFKKIFMDSIKQNGYDTLNNQFLQYARLVGNSDIVKQGSNAIPGLNAIMDLLDNRDLRLTNRNLSNNRMKEWITDPKSLIADDPEYKIKMLNLLTGENAKNWGDPSTAPIQQILNSTKKANILTLAKNWQSSDGEEKLTKGVKKQGKSSGKPAAESESGKKLIQKYQTTAEKNYKGVLNNDALQKLKDAFATQTYDKDSYVTALGKAMDAIKNS